MVGASWAEFKRERGDITMRPVWHALTSLVPVYASLRAHAHFRALADLARPMVADLPDRAAWAQLFTVSSSGAGSQTSNAYLRATGGEPVERAHAVEIIALAICVPLAIAWVYIVLQPMP